MTWNQVYGSVKPGMRFVPTLGTEMDRHLMRLAAQEPAPRSRIIDSQGRAFALVYDAERSALEATHCWVVGEEIQKRTTAPEGLRTPA
jgi:hypothetical protein